MLSINLDVAFSQQGSETLPDIAPALVRAYCDHKPIVSQVPGLEVKKLGSKPPATALHVNHAPS